MLTTSVLVSLCKDIEEAAKNAPKVSFQEPTAETSETVEISKEEEEARRQKRAQRFNLPTPTSDAEKAKKRMERFGTAPTSSVSAAEDEEKKKKRAERFGTVQNGADSGKRPASEVTSSAEDEEAKRKARMLRFKTA